MFAVIGWIAEQRIEESMRRGEFDNLEGKGKKIVFEDDSMVPEDLRMAYKMLKNAGYEFQMPAGAFYFFPKAPGGDDVAFVNRLVEERILAVPGTGFGCPGHFRLAFCVDEMVIRNAADGFAKARAAVR